MFVYADHPDRTAGTDGVKSYSDVFGRDAAIAVVLYRPKWGHTPFTKIEEEAIHSRRIRKGNSDFLLIVKMEPCAAPTWFPESRIYGQWAQLGVDGTADVILARLKVLGNRRIDEAELMMTDAPRRRTAFRPGFTRDVDTRGA